MMNLFYVLLDEIKISVCNICDYHGLEILPATVAYRVQYCTSLQCLLEKSKAEFKLGSILQDDENCKPYRF